MPEVGYAVYSNPLPMYIYAGHVLRERPLVCGVCSGHTSGSARMLCTFNI